VLGKGIKKAKLVAIMTKLCAVKCRIPDTIQFRIIFVFLYLTGFNTSIIYRN